MVVIKLHHHTVTQALLDVERALADVTLTAPPVSSLGDNQLAFTKAWEEREQGIQELLDAYQQIVQKTIEDTKANVDLLKKQDESIVRN
ncbi:YwqI/YxiC family protein [Jeotgalibacillus proteolyticus]|uniref:YwqI/YxiC family protein n=1 Tax=Jeotgalibacillus proteolyticus TaxID=2082395 RepID=UPI003CE8B22C